MFFRSTFRKPSSSSSFVYCSSRNARIFIKRGVAETCEICWDTASPCGAQREVGLVGRPETLVPTHRYKTTPCRLDVDLMGAQRSSVVGITPSIDLPKLFMESKCIQILSGTLVVPSPVVPLLIPNKYSALTCMASSALHVNHERYTKGPHDGFSQSTTSFQPLLTSSLHSRSLQPHPTNKWTPVLHLSCVTLHALLICMHLVLIGVWSQGLEKKTQVSVGRSTTVLTIGLSVTLQAFAVVRIISCHLSLASLFHLLN